jgi:hypothetical protein
MLFDLRGRGRRRTVQIVYGGLALVFVAGAVGLGIGGSGVGLFSNNDDKGNGGGGNVLADKLKAAEKRAKATPNDPQAWAVVARQRYQNAGFDNASGTFTKSGRMRLRAADAAWTRYLALQPKKPDPALARLMTNAYDPTALNEPAKAVKAWDIVAEQQPSKASWASLAISAYLAKQNRKGDLARDEALRLTPKGDRQQLKSQLKSAKAQAAQVGATKPPGG